MQSKRKLGILTVLGVLAGISSAQAASPVGQWSVKFYLEPGLATGATQGICFKSDGTWYSSTFSGWKGAWLQKGDRFRWYGSTGTLGTGEFGQFISNTSMGGEFAHFGATTGSTSSRGNYSLSKTGTTCAAPARAAAAAGGDPSK